MSNPAPLATPSVEVLELAGQPALSGFRLKRLTRALQRRNDRVSKLEARFTYFVSLSAEPSKQDKKRLTALLLSGENAGKIAKSARTIFVVPRPGTISPWSSKATDIAKACDLDRVTRIERGVCYAISFKGVAEQADAFNLAPLLFDRMTEAVLGELKAHLRTSLARGAGLREGGPDRSRTRLQQRSTGP